MKILILSFYYQPDLCAGSFRCSALVDELKTISGVEVEVITTRPNRYASYSCDASVDEVDDNVSVHRVALPSHRSGMLDQARAFWHYYRAARTYVKGRDYDVVFATSSRLFTAFLGARIATAKRAPLYLDIRDIFVDTIKDVLPAKFAVVAKPVFSLLERYSFSRAGRINLVSKGFASYFQSRYPKAELRWFTNGIDKEFVAAGAKVDVSKAPLDKDKLIKMLYAGNFGEGQGLHTIIPRMAKILSGSVEISVVGDGGRKAELLSAIKSEGVTNVIVEDPMSRAQLIERYRAADVLFLHLNDYPAFKKVLPSKIFEYAAMGKPILAGVSGYSAGFLSEEVENSEVFYPGRSVEAAAALKKLKLEDSCRSEFVAKYSRERIMRDMVKDIVGFGEQECVR